MVLPVALLDLSDDNIVDVAVTAVVQVCTDLVDHYRSSLGMEYIVPSASSCELSLIGNKVTIGRTNPVRSIYPDLDLDNITADSAVSIEHCSITFKDAETMIVTDLGSTNGTRVGNFLTEPLAEGQPTEVAITQPLFVGAWTQINFKLDGPDVSPTVQLATPEIIEDVGTPGNFQLG